MVTAAPAEIPAGVVDQLATPGRLVIPVGPRGATQWMTIVEKSAAGVREERTIPVQFVPLTSEP